MKIPAAGLLPADTEHLRNQFVIARDALTKAVASLHGSVEQAKAEWGPTEKWGVLDGLVNNACDAFVDVRHALEALDILEQNGDNERRGVNRWT
jgi:hypothetical protein